MLWSMEAELAESSEWHAHAVHEFVYCAGGSGLLETARSVAELQQGCSYLVPAGETHRFRLAEGCVARLQVACLDGVDTATYLSLTQNALLAELGRESPSMADHGVEAETVGKLWDSLLRGKGSGSDVAVRWSVLGLLLVLHGQARQTRAAVTGYKYRERITEVRRWLDLHLERTVALEELASRFGMSRSLLTREFKRHVGISVIDYCNQRRVEHAAQLLVSGTASVTDAAFASGFANISHFHRQFKAVFGMTPAGFRRQVAGGQVDMV